MAILALISALQVNEPHNYFQDVIEVFEDNHQFTPYELSRFDFLTVNGSKADVEARMEEICLRVEVAVLNDQAKWTFDYSQGTGEELEVWSNMLPPINWYEYRVPFKFKFNVGDLSVEERQLLETIDINHPSVDAAIRKIVKNLNISPENQVEVKDLKGDTP